jgi:MFS family permease
MRMARIAVLTMFAFNGVLIGSWTARIPAVTSQTHASPGTLGLALLGSSVGLILAAPMASRLAARFGARAVVIPSAVLGGIALPVLGVVRSVVELGLAMVLFGTAIGALDVSMNIAAVVLIRQIDRPMMPTFHGAYSFGALGGGVIAGLLVAAGWSPLPHFLLVAVVCVVLVLLVARRTPGERPPAPPPAHRERQAAARLVPPIRRPALWLMAGIMLGSAIAEGANGDWDTLFLVRERGLAQSSATVGLACFNLAMAIARLLGARWERRWGPYRLLAGGGTLAAVGMFAVVFTPWTPVSYVGFAMAGIGLAFCFPVTIGLAGAAGRRPDGHGGEREIGFVTTIAYTGFLTGPPMIGAIAQATDLTVALGVVGLLTAVIVPMVLLARRARDAEIRLQRPAEPPDGEQRADQGQPATGGQRGDDPAADRQVQREIP